MIRSLVAFAVISSTFGNAPHGADGAEPGAVSATLAKGAGIVLTLARGLADDGASETAISPVRDDLAVPKTMLTAFASGAKGTLPSACVFEMTGASGAELVLSEACLGLIGTAQPDLPVFCEDEIETAQGLRQVHDVTCLLRWGYSLEAPPRLG